MKSFMKFKELLMKKHKHLVNVFFCANMTFCWKKHTAIKFDNFAEKICEFSEIHTRNQPIEQTGSIYVATNQCLVLNLGNL